MPKSKIHLLGRITLYLGVASRFAKNHKIAKHALDTGAAHCTFMAGFGWLLLFQPIPRMVLPPRVLTLSRVVSTRPTRVPAATADSSSPSPASLSQGSRPALRLPPGFSPGASTCPTWSSTLPQSRSTSL